MSALDYVRSRVIVDIDQLDPALAHRLGPFCDMTSNQALVSSLVTSAMVSDEEVSALIRRVVARARVEEETYEGQVELALDLITVSIAKLVLPFLSGRVHAQLSPRYSHSVDLQLQHARRLISLFAKDGISPNRVCLKIPSTGAGLAAAKIIEEESNGERTLATTLFSVDQALAAVQAGCLYIAPYFNELSVHFEPETWKEYERPEEDHPMSSVIRQISAMYAELRGRGVKVPLIMPASIVTPKEALAIATLGVDHITISGKVLEALAVDQYTRDFRGEAGNGGGVGNAGGMDASENRDLLGNEGEGLDESIQADPSVAQRLDYALKAFGRCEQTTVDVIKELLE